jgi:hypothetical protein
VLASGVAVDPSALASTTFDEPSWAASALALSPFSPVRGFGPIASTQIGPS